MPLRHVLFLALLAVFLRTLYLVSYSRSLPFIDQPVLDAAFYDGWARRILSEGLFPNEPFYQAPGYPWFLAVVYRVLGPDPRSAVIVQSLLGVLTTLAAAAVALRLFGRKEALLSATLLLLTGSLYFFESKLLVETWSLFLLVLSVLLTLLSDRSQAVAMNEEEGRAIDRAARDGRKPPAYSRAERAAALAAGLLSGAAAVARPNLLLVPLLVALVGFARAAGRRRALSGPLLYALGAVLALLPTTIHNARHGALSPIATSGGINFYIGNYRGAKGIYEDPPGLSGVIARQEVEADSLVAADLGRTLPPGPESGYWFSRGVREITADFSGWLGLVAKKAWLLVNRQEEENNGSLAFEASRVLPLRFFAVPFNFLALGGIIGLFLARGVGAAARRARSDLSPAVAVLLSVLVTGLLFFVMARLRLPAVPFLAIFTAHALARTDEAWRSGARKGAIVLLAAGIAFVALSWRSPLGPARNPEWESHLFLETGRGLEARGQVEKAERAYEEAVVLNPRNVDAYIHLGQRSLENRDLAAAVRWFEEARTAVPDHFGVRNNLGILYYQAQRHADADREMVEAIRLRPDQAGPYFYRGLLARSEGNAARAEAFFQEALQRDPRFTGAYVRLIESLLDRGDLAGARLWANRAGERAVALPPGLAARLR